MNESVSIIIVNFNGGELLIQCVQSALESTVPVEVLVSDNGSIDDSIQILKNNIQDHRLQIHLNHANLGFAAGTNSVIAAATGDYLLFLNPDCLIQQDVLKNMIAKMQTNPDVGMAGCLILNADGSEQAGCRRRVPTPARSLIRILHLEQPFPFFKEKGMLLHRHPLPENPVNIEGISGAFMLVRRAAMEDVGLMDVGYLLHCEDLDWCMRFRHIGWKFLFVPDVAITHDQGSCSKSRPIRVEWHKHKGMIRFYRKFFRHQYPLPLMLLVIISVWLRFVAVAMLLTAKRWFA